MMMMMMIMMTEMMMMMIRIKMLRFKLLHISLPYDHRDGADDCAQVAFTEEEMDQWIETSLFWCIPMFFAHFLGQVDFFFTLFDFFFLPPLVFAQDVDDQAVREAAQVYRTSSEILLLTASCSCPCPCPCPCSTSLSSTHCRTTGSILRRCWRFGNLVDDCYCCSQLPLTALR